jgi:hypothetical protein
MGDIFRFVRRLVAYRLPAATVRDRLEELGLPVTVASVGRGYILRLPRRTGLAECFFDPVMIEGAEHELSVDVVPVDLRPRERGGERREDVALAFAHEMIPGRSNHSPSRAASPTGQR